MDRKQAAKQPDYGEKTMRNEFRMLTQEYEVGEIKVVRRKLVLWSSDSYDLLNTI